MSHFEGLDHIRLQLERVRDEKRSLELALEETRQQLHDLVDSGRGNAVSKGEEELMNWRLTTFAIFENIDNPVWLVNSELRLAACNTAYRKAYLLKHGADPVIGSSVESRMSKKELNVWKEYYVRAFAGEKFTFETSYVDGGDGKCFEMQFNPVIINGKVSGVCVFTVDITERKKAERAVLQGEQRYRTLIETMQEAVLYLDLEGNLQFANDRLYQLTGYSPQELEGSQVLVRLVDSESRKLVSEKKLLHSQGVSGQYEMWITRHGGSKLWMSVSSAPIFNDKGEITGFIATLKDITRKLKAQEALRNSEERYKSLLEYLDDPIWSIDRKYQLVKYNPGFNTWLQQGFEIEAKEGINMLRVMNTAHHDLWKDLYDRAFKGERISSELNLVINDNPCFYKLTINPVPGGSGNITSLSVIIRDITEEKKSQLLKELVYDISALSPSTPDLAVLGKRIHTALSGILDAATFYMVLYDDRSRILSFPYINDNVRPSWIYQTRKFDKGINEYGLKVAKPLLLREKEIKNIRFIDQQKYFEVARPKCWLGVPIKVKGKLAGLMSVLSYTNENAYIEKDLHLLDFIATQVGYILERQSAQEALVKSEAYFRSLTENTSDLMMILNRKGEISYISGLTERILGYSPKELTGKGFQLLYRKGERTEARRRFEQRVRQPGLGTACEQPVVHKDGTIRVLQVVANNLLDDPDVQGVIVNAHDITERKRYENLLKQISEEISGVTGAAFFESLSSKLSAALDGDYVFVGELTDDEESVRTFAFYGEGRKMPDITYRLENTPCSNAFSKGVIIHPSNVQSLFPKDEWLQQFGVESYSGTVLRDPCGNSIGILGVMGKREIQDIEIRRSIVGLFGTRAATELERLRSVKRLEVLYQIDQAILESRPIREISNIALSNLEYFFRRYSRASVGLLNFRKQEIHYINSIGAKRSAIMEGKKVPLSSLRSLSKLKKGEPLLIRDLKKLKKLVPAEKLLISEGLRSYVIYPMLSKGELVGALGIGSHVPHFYRNQDLKGIEEIANQLALSIHDARQNTALRNSEQKNRAILNAIPDIMFHFDKKGTFLGYKAELSQLAIPPAEFIGKTIFDVYEKPFADECLECIRNTIRTREVQMIEYTIGNGKEQDAKYFEARFIAGVNEDVLCLVRDITDRKSAEIALKESQRTYSTLVGNLPGMVYRCSNDRDWTLRFVNEAAYTLTGYKPQEFLSGTISYADLIHPDDKELVWEKVQLALGKKKNFTLNYRIITANKEEKWVWEQGSGIYNDDGRLEVLEGFVIDITTQKVYEQKLRFSDDILNRMGSLVIAGNALGEISYVSPSVQRILGYRPEEVKGKKWLELNNKILKQDTSGAGDIPQGGYISPMVTRNGEMRWISWEYSIGSDGAIIAVGQDITLRREAEIQLVKSNEIISLITKSIDDVIYSVRLTSTGKRQIEYISPQVKQVLGYTDIEYMAMVNSARQSTWIHPSDLLGILKAQKLLRQKQNVVFSYRFKHKETGNYVWVEETVTPRLDENGKHIGNFGILRDITDRKRSEEELQLFNSIVKSTSEGILVTDPNQFDNPVIYANPAFYTITGYHPTEVIGQNCRFLSGKGTSQEVLDELKLALKTGAYFDGELLNYKKDGTPFWNYLTISPIFSVDGRLTHFVGLIKDITERKDAEQLLQEKNHEMNNFVYKASHDLKGPLASIIGVTNLAMTEVKDEYALKFVHFVNESTKRLDSILQDLLEISRVTHSSVQVEKVDVKNLAEEIVFSLQHADHSRNVNFGVKVTGKNYIYTDRKILMSVLQNLVDNAIKYKNDRRPDPQVEILVNDYKHGLMVEVKDNGVGIPDKLQGKVFDMFFRGSERSKGTGLGLYIVKNSVKKLGGFVDYYSREMEGSSFNIYVPDMKDKLT